MLGKSGVVAYSAPVRSQGSYTSLPEDVTSRYQPALGANIPAGSAKGIQYSCGNGKVLAVLTTDAVKVFDTETGGLQQSISAPRVQAISLSPLGAFLVTWSRYLKGEESGNLVVWRLSDGKEVLRLFQKNYDAEKWPAIKWTKQEEIAGHMVRNNVHLYRGGALEEGIIHKVSLCGLRAGARKFLL